MCCVSDLCSSSSSQLNFQIADHRRWATVVDFACQCVNVFIKNIKGGANDTECRKQNKIRKKNAHNTPSWSKNLYSIFIALHCEAATDSIVPSVKYATVDFTYSTILSYQCIGMVLMPLPLLLLLHIHNSYSYTACSTASSWRKRTATKGKRLKQQKGECDDGRCCLLWVYKFFFPTLYIQSHLLFLRSYSPSSHMNRPSMPLSKLPIVQKLFWLHSKRYIEIQTMN